MPLIIWSEDLTLGNEAIDEEHQTLVSYINELDEAIRLGIDREFLGRILDHVIAYTIFHFRHEEELFMATDYPGKVFHCKQHADIRRRILEIQSRFRFGATHELSSELMAFLKDWLVNHVQTTDKQYVPFLKNNDNTPKTEGKSPVLETVK